MIKRRFSGEVSSCPPNTLWKGKVKLISKWSQIVKNIIICNNKAIYFFKRINWKHEEGFCCLNYLLHEKLSKNYEYGHGLIPDEDTKILKYNHGEKSIRAPFCDISRPGIYT